MYTHTILIHTANALAPWPLPHKGPFVDQLLPELFASLLHDRSDLRKAALTGPLGGIEETQALPFALALDVVQCRG